MLLTISCFMPAWQSLSETFFIRNYLILLSPHIFLLSLCVIFLVPKIVTIANVNNSSTIVQLRFAEASSPLLRREVPSRDVSAGPRGPPHQVGPGTNILPLYSAYFCTSLWLWMHHPGYLCFFSHAVLRDSFLVRYIRKWISKSNSILFVYIFWELMCFLGLCLLSLCSFSPVGLMARQQSTRTKLRLQPGHVISPLDHFNTARNHADSELIPDTLPECTKYVFLRIESNQVSELATTCFPQSPQPTSMPMWVRWWVDQSSCSTSSLFLVARGWAQIKFVSKRPCPSSPAPKAPNPPVRYAPYWALHSHTVPHQNSPHYHVHQFSLRFTQPPPSRLRSRSLGYDWQNDCDFMLSFNWLMMV